MAEVSASVDYVLQNEGGFTDDPDDSGGATNFGVTIGDLSRWLGRQATVEEVKDMTRDTAIQIITAYYWNTMQLGAVNDQSVATCMLDVGFNDGTPDAIKFAQEAVNDTGLAQLTVDSLMGPDTLAGINKVSRPDFINNFYNHVRAHYESIVANNPEDSEFLDGWLARASRMKTLI